MQLYRVTFGAILALSAAACTNTVVIEDSIRDYDAISGKIELGTSKEDVLATLTPTQSALPSEMRKRPDRFIREGVRVEIYYFRTAWYDDGLTTDDEFTPYVFHDGRLVAIGWHAIGGAKSLSAPVSSKALSTQ